MQHMQKLESSPMKEMKRLIKAKISQKFRERLLPDDSPVSPTGIEEDPLEQFFSDEDPSNIKED